MRTAQAEFWTPELPATPSGGAVGTAAPRSSGPTSRSYKRARPSLIEQALRAQLNRGYRPGPHPGNAKRHVPAHHNTEPPRRYPDPRATRPDKALTASLRVPPPHPDVSQSNRPFQVHSDQPPNLITPLPPPRPKPPRHAWAHTSTYLSMYVEEGGPSATRRTPFLESPGGERKQQPGAGRRPVALKTNT